MQNQQYPPQGYPPQHGYAPPAQQSYGAPPQPGQYGAPPPQQYGQYPPQGYGAPPPQQGYGAPPPGPYGAQPPQQQYGAPPPQQQYGAPPPQQPYGAPPPGPYGAPQQPPYGAPQGQPTPPSIGYIPNQTAPMDVSRDVEGLHKAMKGFGTNERELIRILSKQDPIQINTIRTQFNQRFMKDLIKELEKETSGYFEKGLVAIARGPLTGDAYALYESMKGLGTKESVLNDVLCCRSNADINAIKAEYHHLFKKPLESDVRGDLSAGTEQLFVMILAARRNEESAPVIPQQIEQDVTELSKAIGSMIGKDSANTCQMLTSRSDAQLRAITQSYQTRFQKSLASVIKSKFSGHMEDALLLILARANNRALSDAEQLEDSMAGLGTKDELLVQRVVRAHWNRQHMQTVRTEYQKRYKRDLVGRIKGETRGDYEKLMVACVE
ncbi:hypothetical protein BCR34DRAFT_51339 [Clohesyomyces aquaticus]|uniref:Annexin n=1 Tax=Clohesyomyces aquaticus TaxID=1231657 RepID=A0A1Y2A5G6_9PLEO|nr:hypothetical protein BCR34DRAFT_51339 [Clohesyomyces aquaticus]